MLRLVAKGYTNRRIAEKLVQILADGGAHYMGITGLEGEVGLNPLALGTLLSTEGLVSWTPPQWRRKKC